MLNFNTLKSKSRNWNLRNTKTVLVNLDILHDKEKKPWLSKCENVM